MKGHRDVVAVASLNIHVQIGFALLILFHLIQSDC